MSDPLIDAGVALPSVALDLRYASARNLFGEVLYDAEVFALRRSVATRLGVAARAVEAQGFRLLAWDGYRPLAVQRRLWALCPVPGFVASPERGSNHNRGTAVDVALADLQGRIVELPCDLDDFSARAHSAYPAATLSAAAHRDLLRAAMLQAGFTGIQMEWWHFDAPEARSVPIEEVSLASLRGRV